MENTTEIKIKIRKFIIETTYAPDDQVNNNTLIFAQGIFDSMGFISLIDYIESTFAIKANDSDLIEDNFESIDAIARFIGRKLN
ncbi:MAG TPA: phosphopantetheine-binding protein [Bacteroidales bacterium]|jgi:acyl carrier protein